MIKKLAYNFTIKNHRMLASDTIFDELRKEY